MHRRFAFPLCVLALFFTLAIQRPLASQSDESIARMVLSHRGPDAWLSFLDTQSPPGTFVSAIRQPVPLAHGYAWPSPMDPEFLVGITPDGTTVRKVGTTGSTLFVKDLGDTFVRITDAWLIRPQPGNSGRPSSGDLVPHYLVAGELNGANPQLTGNSTGFMLLNPATLEPFRIGATTVFLGPSDDVIFEECSFAVWPGLDGNYDTLTDNEYRYILAYTLVGTEDAGIGVLSLNYHETMNGQDPPDIWNPVPAERGPHFTNVYPRVDANTKWGGTSFPRSPSLVPGEQIYVRSYRLRPGIPNVDYTDVAANRDYVLAGWVNDYKTVPPSYRPWLGAYDLGRESVDGLILKYLYRWIPPPAHPFCRFNSTPDVFKALEIIGDWGFATTNEGDPAGDIFGDIIQMIYIPEMLDGVTGEDPADDGYRGQFNAGTGPAGFMGHDPAPTGLPGTIYFGSGPGTSTIYATTRSAYSDWLPNIASAGGGTIPIDCHTNEEKLLGMNVRRAPQGMTGFHQSTDPANNFPGSNGGSGNGKGGAGCSSAAVTSAWAGLAWIVMLLLILRNIQNRG